MGLHRGLCTSSRPLNLASKPTVGLGLRKCENLCCQRRNTVFVGLDYPILVHDRANPNKTAALPLALVSSNHPAIDRRG